MGVKETLTWQRNGNKKHKTARKGLGIRNYRDPRHQSGQETASEPANMKYIIYHILVCVLRINILSRRQSAETTLRKTVSPLKMIMRRRTLHTIIIIICRYGLLRLSSALSLLTINEKFTVNDNIFIFHAAPHTECHIYL